MDARKSFQEQMDELYLDIVRMANAVIETIEATREAFESLDAEQAEAVIAGDDTIDDFIRKIEASGIEMLARQAQVAIDMRTIIVTMWLAQHLERVGDLCVNISKAVRHLDGVALSPWMRESIEEMFRRSRSIMERAMEAFKKRDPDIAAELVVMDDTVDRINRSFFTHREEDDDIDVDTFVRVVMIARFLERVADHAVDIGDNIRYMVTGALEEE
jgi:phosphate transport system protein